MAELKTFDYSEMNGHLITVKYFSDVIGMGFGLDKCLNVTFKKERLTENTLNRSQFYHKD